MTSKLVIGLDGQPSGQRALTYGESLASKLGTCELLVVYVIEWSPFSFQTAEENERRHKRREEEIATAMERIVTPAVNGLKATGLNARGIVQHGNVADTLISIAEEEGADQIIICRSSEDGIAKRLFGSSTANLVMHASVPVTVVNPGV
ncbi:Nucleotide-binding universal stress protein, UspA family [Cohaesibacter sp. ES.047]|uniref:universal stress protein n=1 Tax=Cohaesibacter sp. ES.047 TaxID=1798205 RepID=UPI000BB9A666|nr:universal stress protein [Cohaesibacter sp. ES.047]SNY94382.1 Nucleotide-binding universal stress protein, UspA family [Cohaesibacter sp. ES.047]